MWSIKRFKIVLFVAIGLLVLLVTSCTIVFKKTYYKVEFYVQDELVSTQSVLMNRAAIAPEDPVVEGYVFKGWDQQFNYVTKDMQIHAILVKIDLSDLEKLNIDLNNLKDYMANKKLSTLNQLPIKGAMYDSVIEWVSPDASVNIDDAGHLQVVSGTRNINLYVILSLNDSVIYYEFNL